MMPQMPNLPSLNTDSSESEVGASSSPFTDGSAEVKAAEPEVNAEELSAKPEIVKPSESSNHVKLQVPKRGIEVVALRKGFYNQNRLKEGDVFHIKSTEDFGDWFKCTDPLFEKERVKILLEARKKK